MKCPFGFARCASAALIIVGCLGRPVVAGAQQASLVTGRVTVRATGEPLAGARILVLGTVISTSTNRDGRYRLPAVPPGRIQLVATMVGHQAVTRVLTVAEGAPAVADFELPPATVSLDEIHVTAAGERRKRQMGNSIATIDANAVTREAPVTKLADVLQARVAGVQVLPSSGAAGTAGRIRIRGSASMLLANEPLFYVDGVRVESRANSLTISLGGQSISRINDINPEDIESIEILRGASATTLYGTDAANGIILITTRRGRAGKPQWNFRLERGIAVPQTDFPDNYEGVDAAGNTCRLIDVSAGLCQQADILTANPLTNPRTSPFHNGVRQQYGLNVSGGSESVQYYFGGEWEVEDGVYGISREAQDTLRAQRGELEDRLVNPNNVKRLSLRANLHGQLSEKADLTASVGFVSSDTRIPQNGWTYLSPILGGTYGWARDDAQHNNGWKFFPPEDLFELEGSQATERVTASLNTTWRPTHFLNVRGTVGFDETTMTDVFAQPTGRGPDRPPSLRDGRRTANRVEVIQYTVDFGTSATVPLSDAITSETSVGVQYFRNIWNKIGSSGRQIVPGTNSLYGAAITSGSESTRESITFGGFFQQQIGLHNRLFVSGAVRSDDNSGTGKDVDLSYYPRFSASWVISDEPFFPTVGFLNDLSLRGAWGATGNQPRAQDAIRTFSPVATVIGGQEVNGVTLAGIGNSKLRAESSQELELGLDAVLFGGRLGIDLTYYNKRTRNALVYRTLAPSLGGGSNRLENLGLVENKGLEFTATAQILDSDKVAWSLNANASTNANKLLEMCPPNPETGECEIVEGGNEEGFPLGGIWRRPHEGFADENADGIITSDEVIVGDTAVFLGPTIPTKQAVLSTALTLFDRVRISGLADYRGGSVVDNQEEYARCRYYKTCHGLNDPTAPLEEQAKAYGGVGAFTEPAWFVKLRELSLTLFAPRSWAAAIGADRLALIITGRNLLRWTDYSGMDPEVNTAGASQFGAFDWGTTPPVRYWLARLDIGF
jgi:TonB-linked SusC/RagA family outer membrane protein